MKTMSAAALAALKEFNETAIWHSKCRKCGEAVKGTLAQLKEHKCGGGDDPNSQPGTTA
jgi:hypothetical protein